jgi:hypothetical protein
MVGSETDRVMARGAGKVNNVIAAGTRTGTETGTGETTAVIGSGGAKAGTGTVMNVESPSRSDHTGASAIGKWTRRTICGDHLCAPESDCGNSTTASRKMLDDQVMRLEEIGCFRSFVLELSQMF